MRRLLFPLILCVSAPGCPDAPTRDQGAADRPAIRVTAPPPVQVRDTDPTAVQYTLRFPGRANHYIDVEAVFPVDEPALELSMAVWTPGSYLVREFSRNIEALSATTLAGESRDVVKVAKNRWRVAPRGVDRLVVRYRLYASELSVRTNYVDSAIAVLNGAPTFLTIADDGKRAFDIALELPEEWPKSVTALDPHPLGAAHRYLAPDYDTLVDSPIVLGDPTLHEFEIQGVAHTLANFGGDSVWDGALSAKGAEAIARGHAAFWGEIPYGRYVFLNVLLNSGGGLEHKGSTLIMSSPFNTSKPDKYRDWLELISHEFFHTWNVKRLRPKTLGPFDYESENYTRSLWIAEGITSYYDALLVRRAGLMDDKAYFKRLTEEIEKLQTEYPGRAMQSLSESSYDAWIKFYRPDENFRNTAISYYNKGALVGFLLDARIREATQNQRNLDHAMRLMYTRFSGATGYTPDDFRAVVAEVAGTSLDDFFARYVDGTDELDYAPALAFYGLRFAPKVDALDADADADPGYLGVEVDSAGKISRVVRDTPAYQAGLQVGDELLAIEEYRVLGGELSTRLELYRPGAQVSILVARFDKLQRIGVTLSARPETSWTVEIDRNAGTLANSRRARWLAGDSQPSEPAGPEGWEPEDRRDEAPVGP